MEGARNSRANERKIETTSRSECVVEDLNMIAEAKPIEVKKYTRKDLTGDAPTWCPGCGDFSILSIYFKMMEKRQIPHEQITSIAGIGCSSRFPYFVNAHGAHFL